MPASALDQDRLWLLFSILQLQHFIKLGAKLAHASECQMCNFSLGIMYLKISILGCGFLHSLEVQQSGRSPAPGLLHAMLCYTL